MRESLDWQRARYMPAMLGTNAKGKPIPNKERSDLFKATQSRFGFSSASIRSQPDMGWFNLVWSWWRRFETAILRDACASSSP
jgi:hypothetical protein